MKSNAPDDIITFFVVIFLAATFGPVLAGNLFPQVRAFLVDWHILVTDGVLVPVLDGAGLDIGRVLIAGGVLAVLILLLVWAFRLRLARSRKVEG